MRPLRLVRTAVRVGVLVGVLFLDGCSYSDIFGTPGPRLVLLKFFGDSTLAVGSPEAFGVTVSSEGIPVPNPNLSIAADDTTIVSINAAHDSLTGLRTGITRLRARLQDPMFSDSLPTLVVRIRVHS